MTLKEFREFTKDLPEDTVMWTENYSCEWYGNEAMALGAWRIDKDGRLFYGFCNYS